MRGWDVICIFLAIGVAVFTVGWLDPFGSGRTFIPQENRSFTQFQVSNLTEVTNSTSTGIALIDYPMMLLRAFVQFLNIIWGMIAYVGQGWTYITIAFQLPEPVAVILGVVIFISIIGLVIWALRPTGWNQ